MRRKKKQREERAEAIFFIGGILYGKISKDQ
jgi:hypothetical protein